MWCQNKAAAKYFWPALLLAGLINLTLTHCYSPAVRDASPAFYHWKTTLALSSSELTYLDSLGCKKLYVKVLDIGRDWPTGEIQPYSRLEMTDTTGLSRFEIVPTIFITNEVFKKISEENIEWLAGKVAASLLVFLSGREVQFDCDWTPSTRDAFFLFLKKITKHLPANTRLSATIRLHQYKFPEKTGVPPVERGMLMFYNTGDIENPDEKNSIFRPEDAEKYLFGAPKNYPLPLDVALPVFSWALVYREGELWKIVPEVSENELNDTTRFEKISNQQPTFHLQKGTFLSAHYLRPGDLLRMETISPDLLLEAAQLAAQADLADDAAVAFFHLDAASVRRYPVQLLDSVCRIIRFPEKKK